MIATSSSCIDPLRAKEDKRLESAATVALSATPFTDKEDVDDGDDSMDGDEAVEELATGCGMMALGMRTMVRFETTDSSFI